MKKFVIYLSIIIFCTTGFALAQSGYKSKSKHNKKTKIEKHEKQKNKKIKDNTGKNKDKVEKNKKNKENEVDTQEVKGKKNQPSEGVQKAAEKGKGKKKGLFERWFGGNKEE